MVHVHVYDLIHSWFYMIYMYVVQGLAMGMQQAPYTYNNTVSCCTFMMWRLFTHIELECAQSKQHIHTHVHVHVAYERVINRYGLSKAQFVAFMEHIKSFETSRFFLPILTWYSTNYSLKRLHSCWDMALLWGQQWQKSQNQLLYPLHMHVHSVIRGASMEVSCFWVVPAHILDISLMSGTIDCWLSQCNTFNQPPLNIHSQYSLQEKLKAWWEDMVEYKLGPH